MKILDINPTAKIAAFSAEREKYAQLQKETGKIQTEKTGQAKINEKGRLKSIEKALKNKPASIKSPYVYPLSCKGLVQQDLKHN